MDKRKIVRYLLITLSVILGVLVFLSITGTVAHAAGLVDNTVSDANTYSKYPLENYQLDFYVDSSWDWLPWNWLDGIGKSIQYGLYAITNFVWTVSLYISNATGYVVQEAYKLDFISDTASSIGKNIQTLAGVTSNGFSSEGFYVGFLLILILVMGIYVAYTGLLKRETTKAIHAVINFLVVFILSASFIAYAPNYISKINDFSADISSSALSLGTKIVLPDSNSKGKDSVDLIRDSLFSIQVKQPWLLLQYGESDIETLGSDRVESLLSANPDTDDREDVVIEEIEDKDNAYLSVTKTMTRLGMVVFLFIFNIGISAFVFLLTGMMIFSQVLFIIYAMFLPISFVLSMIPTYEGMAKKALTKLFNTVMMRAGITLIITTAFSISTMFYSISSGYPFFMVAFLQIVTFAGIYFKLGDLMTMFSLQSSDTQQVSRRIMRHPYMFLNRRARRLERKIGRTMAAGAAGGVAGAAAASASTKKADNTKQTGNTHTRANHNTSASSSGGNSKPPALPDFKSQKPLALPDKKSQTDSSQTVHSSQSNTQESQSTSKRGIVDKKSVSKQPQSDKKNPQRPIVDKERQSNGSATKRAAPVHERPATTPVPVKSDSQAAALKPEQNVKERPVTVTKEQPQSSKSKEPVTKSQENVRTQVVRESRPADKQASSAVNKHSQATTDISRQTVQRQKQTKTVQKKTTNQSTMKKSTSKKGGKK
ncbi:CD3337/EF1877 family mobilome membrane protein [Holdemanella biformis]|uniref:CD3337/EF1877 family mobilome membrane protein n=1 Tax=Holdemanella biformis TaxID=1735 RepID=UPI001C38EAB8|nr:YtxH domain-containing protein [Holdemanella biformis]MBV4130673.1 YtxH domain-containing protein [Holdemanella biformis]MBV4150466.1 YtxH domain-containing protein [Holdemanella biformis]